MQSDFVLLREVIRINLVAVQFTSEQSNKEYQISFVHPVVCVICTVSS